eukprot:3618415-Pleurochrysis_carterae.AAC.1
MHSPLHRRFLFCGMFACTMIPCLSTPAASKVYANESANERATLVRPGVRTYTQLHRLVYVHASTHACVRVSVRDVMRAYVCLWSAACFSRQSAYACKLRDDTVVPHEAYEQVGKTQLLR